MKKKIILAGSSLLLLGMGLALGVSASNEKNAWNSLFLDNIEATADCEITNSSGKILYKCTGPGSCSITYLGKTLECDSKLVAL